MSILKKTFEFFVVQYNNSTIVSGGLFQLDITYTLGCKIKPVKRQKIYK